MRAANQSAHTEDTRKVTRPHSATAGWHLRVAELAFRGANWSPSVRFDDRLYLVHGTRPRPVDMTSAAAFARSARPLLCGKRHTAVDFEKPATSSDPTGSDASDHGIGAMGLPASIPWRGLEPQHATPHHSHSRAPTSQPNIIASRPKPPRPTTSSPPPTLRRPHLTREPQHSPSPLKI
jgi:hypothetical protein